MRTINSFLNQIDAESIHEQEVRWIISNDDANFFNQAIDILDKHNIKNILDISCGHGSFVKMCLGRNINAYGIDPVPNDDSHIYRGTYSSIIKNSKILDDYKFDCISICNTLHGKFHKEEELIGLFNFFKEHAKYILISCPLNDKHINESFDLLHEFSGSHGEKGVFHKLFKVRNK